MADENGSALATSEQNNGKLKRQTFGDLSQLEGAMKRMAASCNLIAPIVALDHIPMFHEVSLRVVSIDPESETYVPKNSGGKRALTKTALGKLCQAARIEWDGVKSGRVDDRSDPHYVHFRSVGYWPDFDGRTALQISGEKQMDLRDGSPMASGMSDKQLMQARTYILEHAESKAKNRAIRQALALKSSYTEEELKRPFVVPTLVETGRCDDPELRRLYYEKKLDGKGLATRMLFGSQPMLKPGDMEVIEAKATPVKPPPVGTVPDEDDDIPVQQDMDTFSDPFGGGR